MIRTTFLFAALIGFGATAIASVGSQALKAVPVMDSGFSTIAMTDPPNGQIGQTLKVNHHLVLQKCALENCADTPQ